MGIRIILISLFTALFSLFTTNIFSQEVGMPSPTAANLGKVADQGVNYFNGKPNIGIPIFSIGNSQLSLSVNLSYDATGVRVSEVPDWVGAGWALNAGGVITRSVKGLPDDDTNNGYYYNKPLMDFMKNIYADEIVTSSEYASMHAGKSMQDRLNDMKNGNTDSEMDVFYYNFDGQSGKFVLGFQGDTPLTIPQSDIKIEYSFSSATGVSSISQFVLTTPDGKKYTFDEVEYSIAQPGTSPTTFSYSTAWFLTKVEAPGTSDVITLDYYPIHTTVHKYNNEEYELSGTPTADRYTYQKFNRTNLKEIVFNDQKLSFLRGLRTDAKTPSDWSPANTQQEYLLTSVEKFIGTAKVREFDFTYSYPGSRLFLNQVQEKGMNGEVLPPTKFTYHNASSLPDRLNTGIDHWGFYNGKGSYNTSAKGFIQKGEWFDIMTSTYNYHDGADRSVDTAKVKSGILTKIEYPTGGSVEYQYESNDYSHIIFPNKTNGGLISNNISVASGNLSNVSGIEQESFFDDNAEVISVSITLDYICNGTYLDWDRLYVSDETNPLLNGWHENRAWVDIDHTTNNNTTCAQFTSHYGSGGPGGVRFTKTIDLNIDYESGNTFDFTFDTNLSQSYQENNDTATLTYSVSGVDKVFPGSVRTPGPGLRIKKTTMKSGDSSIPDVVKNYVYNDATDPAKSSGVMYNEPIYARFYPNELYPEQRSLARIWLTISQQKAFGMGGNGFAGYERVEEVISNNGKTEIQFYSIGDKTIKLRDNLEDFRDFYTLNSTMNPNVILTPYMGSPKRNKVYNESGNVLTENIYTENETDASTIHPSVKYFGISVDRRVYGASSLPAPLPYYMDVPFLANTKTISNVYNGESNWVSTIVDVEYGDSGHKNPTKVTETNSLTSEAKITEYMYAHEVTSDGSSPVTNYAPMKTSNMLTQPYLVTTKKGTEIVSKEWTLWSNQIAGNSDWLPEEKWVAKTNNPSLQPNTSIAEKVVDYVKYDAKGNPLEMEDAKGVKTSYDWSNDGSIPLGIFQNASQNNVLAHSFALDGLDGWAETNVANNVTTSWSIVDNKLRMRHPGNTGSNWGSDYIKETLPSEITSRTVIEMDVTVGPSSDWSFIIGAGGSSYGGGNGGSEGLIWAGFFYGSWRAYTGSSWVVLKSGFVSGQTYRLKMVADPVTDKVDYYVDGEKVQTAVDGRSVTSGISVLSLGNYGRPTSVTDWYIDNVRMYPEAAQAASQEVDPLFKTPVAMKDAAGATSRYEYDDLGRLTNTYNANGKNVGQNNYFYSLDTHSSFDVTDPNRVEQISYNEVDGFKEPNTSDFSTIDGTPNYDYLFDGERTVKVNYAGGGWDGFIHNDYRTTGSVKADFYIDNSVTSGSALPVYLRDSSTNYVFGLRYDKSGDSFKVHVRKGSSTWLTRHTFSFTAEKGKWYTAEIVREGDGTKATIWLYEKGKQRDYNDMYTETGFSSTLGMRFQSTGGINSYYVANMYIGNTQTSIQYMDGIGRGIQTQVRGGSEVILNETRYDERGLPFLSSRPIIKTGTAAYAVNLMGSAFNPNPANSSTLSLPANSDVENYYDTVAPTNEEDYAYTYTQYEKSPLARVEKSTLPGSAHKIGSGNEVITTYGLNTTETFATSAQGSTPAKTWAINTLAKTVTEDPSGKKTISYTDGWGQVIASGVDMNGDNRLIRANDLVTEFAYDVRGNLVRVEDPRGLATTYTYNVLGQLTQKQLPDQTHPHTYKYDDKGRLRFHRDPNLDAASDHYYYTKYDDLNRVTDIGKRTTSADFNDQADINDQGFPYFSYTMYIHNSYDGNNAATGAQNLKGRLTRVQYRDIPNGTWGYTWYSYNNLGLIEWVIQRLPGLSGDKKITYTYDELGRLTRVDYQAGQSDDFYQRYTYDALGRLNKVETSTDGTSWTKDAEYTSYLADGQVGQLRLGNSNIQTVDYSYTIQGWLDKINNGSISTGTNGDRFGMNLDYAYNGNISLQQWRQVGTAGTNQNTLSYTYSYDNANRLTAANFGGSGYSSSAFDLSNVGYDKNGNITGFIRNDNSGSSYPDGYLSMTFESNTNRITNIQEQVDYTNWDVDHDASGNMTKNLLQGFTSVDYDWRNLSTQLIKGANTLQYAYDGEGNRVKKKMGSTETHYVRGAGGETIAVYENDVVQFHNMLVGSEVIGIWDGSQRRYFLKDHLGSVRATVDQSGNVDGYDDYYPFGLVMPGRSSNSANPTDNYKFTGHERDDDAGLTLDYMMARNYDPVIGRFLQIDPLTDQFPGWTPYHYVHNNPLNLVDPTGMAADCPKKPCSISLGIGGLGAFGPVYGNVGVNLVADRRGIHVVGTLDIGGTGSKTYGYAVPITFGVSGSEAPEDGETNGYFFVTGTAPISKGVTGEVTVTSESEAILELVSMQGIRIEELVDAASIEVGAGPGAAGGVSYGVRMEEKLFTLLEFSGIKPQRSLGDQTGVAPSDATNVVVLDELDEPK